MRPWLQTRPVRRGAFVRRCEGAFAFVLRQYRCVPAPLRLRALRRHLSISAQARFPAEGGAAPSRNSAQSQIQVTYLTD